MTIQRVDGVLQDIDLAGRLSIGIESDNLSCCIAEARRRNAAGVFGSPSFGFRQADLSFLSALPGLQKIWFWDVELTSIEGLYELRRLKSFGVHPKRPAVDFTRLDSLEELVWEYKARDAGVDTLENLRMLHLWHYNPRSASFDGLAIPGSVEELQINHANPRSLDGLREMPNLTSLEIHRCRNLETLAGLPQVAPRLKRLVVNACGKVSDGAEVVQAMPALEHAYVRDAILVHTPD